MNEAVNISRTTFCITHRCTLKCKLCIAFIPYFHNPTDLSFEDAKKILDIYFKVVDTVDIFNVTGGEPLMNRDLLRILQLVSHHKAQIKTRIDFVTNGTLSIPKDILDFIEKTDNFRVVISDYGTLSTKTAEIVQILQQRGIGYKVHSLYGDNPYFNGWADFTDHTLRHKTLEERDAQGLRCIHKLGRYFMLEEGELHGCSRAFWRMRQGIIPRIEDEYVDLMDTTQPIATKRAIVRNMNKIVSTVSCAYCDGLWNGQKRYPPAEQL